MNLGGGSTCDVSSRDARLLCNGGDSKNVRRMGGGEDEDKGHWENTGLIRRARANVRPNITSYILCARESAECGVT